MDRPLNVLVLPAGSEGASEVFQALRNEVGILLHGASTRVDHGDLLFQRLLPGIPAVQDPGFFKALGAAVQAHGIDAIFPCHDTVAEVLAVGRDRIAARVVCSSAEVAAICRSKFRCHGLVEDTVFAPQRHLGAPPVEAFPVFVKPDRGEGGKGTALLSDPAAYERFFREQDRSTYLVTEHLPGAEYTVDCFSDRHGVLRFVGPRGRDRVWAGVSVRTATVEVDPFRPLAELLHDRLRPRGLWFFQVKRDAAGAIKLLEVSTRTASSMGLYRQLGVNLPLLALCDALDQEVDLQLDPRSAVMDRALDAVYVLDLAYSEVYIELDDTLVVNGRVVPQALTFLYQCRARGVRVVLLTRHIGDPRATLERWAISPALFDAVVRVAPDEEKAVHVRSDRAVFIDGSPHERRKVHQRTGVPVFGVDAIGALIDHRA